MDSQALIAPTTEKQKAPLLPAGSTLELANGVHVPHPNAESNLPGAGDSRLGETDAVTVTLDGHQRPLNEAKPIAEKASAPRLPAGSILELPNGIRVPHPHAEVNLPGAGDPRLGDTEAVIETLQGEQRPLHERKPKVLAAAAAATTQVAQVSAADPKGTVNG